MRNRTIRRDWLQNGSVLTRFGWGMASKANFRSGRFLQFEIKMVLKIE